MDRDRTLHYIDQLTQLIKYYPLIGQLVSNCALIG